MRNQLYSTSLLFLVFALITLGAYAGKGDVNRKDQLGLRQGYWVITGAMSGDRLYPFEATVEEGFYKDDRREGLWKKYHPNGKLRSEITYEWGKPFGPYKVYYASGQIEESGNWEEGRNIGEFKRFHDNGTMQQHFYFDETGRRTGTQYYFHDNGQPSLIVDIVAGKENGPMKRYDETGRLIEEKSFDKGYVKSSTLYSKTKDKIVTIKSDPHNQDIGKEAPVAKGKSNAADRFEPNGYNTLYDANGSITQSGEYKNGKLYNGKWYKYSSSGVLMKVDLYRKGRYIGEGIIEN